MAQPEWGKKRQCPKCGTRFYDLGKDDPIICISCENKFKPEIILKSKMHPMEVVAEVKKEDDDDDVVLDADSLLEEDDDVDVELDPDDNTTVLSDDDDNVAVVVDAPVSKKLDD